jgi:glucose/arabinose dehydrogenase
MKKLSIIFILFVLSQVRVCYSQTYIAENVVTGLTQPVAFTFLPNNNVIITQQTGLAKIYTLGNVFVSNFWNFTDSVVVSNERGLLGVCLDPNYSSNHYVYFYYIHTGNTYRVVRLTENNNAGTNPYILFNEPNSGGGTLHVGGNMRFGPGNKLYITVGDNGTNSNGQSLTTFKGKILRINANGTIPTDNPFYDDGNPLTGNDDRIWAYGLRNSFDFCFSPINDSLYATENMGGTPDEVNYIRKGKNYGWPICVGYCTPYNPLYADPLNTIPGNGMTNYAPTGIMIYTGTVMPELTGKLIFIGIGASSPPVLFRGLAKCELGNPPYYDTLLSRTVMLDITGTGLMQGSDGFIYSLRYSPGALRRIRHDPNSVTGNSEPVSFHLHQNYPNPFNPATSIKYEIPVHSFVTLKIYNVLGIEIAALVNEAKQHGAYEVSWDASAYPSGVYFYELSAGEFKERKKMVLIK